MWFTAAFLFLGTVPMTPPNVHAAKYVPEKSSIFPFEVTDAGSLGVDLEEAIVCYLTLSQG